MPWRSMVTKPSTTVSSTVSIRPLSLAALAFTRSSAASRAVMSRMIAPKPRGLPSDPGIAVIRTLARKRDPFFLTRTPISS